MIQLNNVTKEFSKNKGIFNVNLSFEKGKIYGVIGHNAAGKTTLLKLMTGLLVPSSGKVQIHEVNKREEILNKISYLPDSMEFSQGIKLEKIVDFMKVIHPDLNSKLLESLLKRFNISIKDKYSSLSKGNKMAFRYALCISRDVDCYILDEPFSGIDPVTRKMILNGLFTDIDIENKLVVLSSHELHDIDGHLDNIVVINMGKVDGVFNVDRIKEENHMTLHEWYMNTYSKVMVID